MIKYLTKTRIVEIMNKLFLSLVMASCFCISHVMHSSLRDIATHKAIDNILSTKPKQKNELKPELEGENKMLDVSNPKVFFIEDFGTKTGFCYLAKDAVKIPKFAKLIGKSKYQYAIKGTTPEMYISILRYVEAQEHLKEKEKETNGHAAARKIMQDLVTNAKNKPEDISVLARCLSDLYGKDQVDQELLAYLPKKTKDTPGYFTNHRYLTFGSIAVLLAAISIWYFKDSLNLNFGSSSKI